MSEIKFSVWTGTLMFTGIEIKDLKGLMLLTDPKNKVLQFTGLRDKHGVEIYVGHIVRNSKYDLEFEIVFEAPSFRGKNLQTKQTFYFDYRVNDRGWSDLEILGNVYENKK